MSVAQGSIDDRQEQWFDSAWWDRTPDSLLGSHADNWADIRDRMNFICDLFRSYHVDPGLFGAPYTPAQCAQIEAGCIPGGAL